MKVIMLTLGGVTAAWFAAPLVDMAVRGTTDHRTLARCHEERPVPSVVIPAPRRGTDRLAARV